VLDELRRRDWAGRVVRTRARCVTSTTEQLTARLGRAPSVDEVATATGLSRGEVGDLVTYLERASRIERRLALGTPDGEGTIDVADEGVGPDGKVLEDELYGYLHDAVDALPERLRWAVVGHFGEGREMKDLAEELGVTASRVSQLCSEAISLLREGISAQLDPEAAALEQEGTAARRRSAYVAAVGARAAQRRHAGPVPSAA
jgi:RNA polymerase sigma factor for flagellar operon FliA